MKSVHRLVPAASLALFALACGDPTSSDSLFDDSAVTADVAASAGDAVVLMLNTMAGNEDYAAGASLIAAGAPNLTSSINVDRTRACYDASDAAVVNCLPFSSVRMIVIGATISGTRSSTRTNAAGATVTWTGTVHRASNDTTRRVFTESAETSRVHSDVAVGNDTTTFTDGVFTRRLAEAVRDSVKSLTFNLPRSSNPYPVSGSIVRRSTATVEISKGDQGISRDVSNRIEVLFPADAQGNVTLKLNARTCQLNLVTHAVTNCQ
jgi:hypothetical protein